MRKSILYIPISFLLFIISTGGGCTRATPPIPIATAGQNTLIEKRQFEATYAIGGNMVVFGDDASNAEAHYGRIRYGVSDKYNIAIDGIVSNSEYRSFKIGSQYKPFKFLVFDSGLGRGFGKGISRTGLSLGLTLDARFTKSGRFGIFSSVRTGHNFSEEYDRSLPHNQHLFCLGMSGYIDNKKHLYWFLELGDVVHHRGNPIKVSGEGRQESYMGMGLSYRFRLPKKKQ